MTLNMTWEMQERGARLYLSLGELNLSNAPVWRARPAHVCMVRSPDTARIKDKMLFASSKDALRRALGVATEIQATDPTEVEYETSQLYLMPFFNRLC
jgi:hypothetical protein